MISLLLGRIFSSKLKVDKKCVIRTRCGLHLLLQATFMNFPGLCVFVAHLTCHWNGEACLTPAPGIIAASDHTWWFGSIGLLPSCMPAYTYHPWNFSFLSMQSTRCWHNRFSCIMQRSAMTSCRILTLQMCSADLNGWCNEEKLNLINLHSFGWDLTLQFSSWFKFGKIPQKTSSVIFNAVRYYYIVRYMELHSSEMRDSVFSGTWSPPLDGSSAIIFSCVFPCHLGSPAWKFYTTCVSWLM